MKSLRYFVWAQVAWVILLIPMMVLRYTLPEGSTVQHVFQLITTFSSVVPVVLIALQFFFARGAFKNSTGLATDLAYLGIHDKELEQKVTGRRVKVSRNRLGSLQYDFLDAPVIKKPLSRFQAFMDYGRFVFASRDDMSSVWVREGRRYTAQGDQTWTKTLVHLRLLTWETIRLEKKLLRQRKLGDSRTGFPLGAYILAGTDKIDQLRDPAQRDKIVERALAFYNTEHTPQTVYQTRSLDMEVLREFLDLPTSWMREATSHMIDPDYVLRVSGVRKDAEYA